MIFSATTFSKYVAGQFLRNFGVMLLILLGIVYVFDVIELLRRFAGVSGQGLSPAFVMAGLKLPYTGQMVIPFCMLFASMFTCWKLNRTSELMVIRSAGVSAWQFLSPMVAVAFLIGIVAATVYNPIASVMLARFQQKEHKYFHHDSDTIAVSGTGIWLRQPLEDEKAFPNGGYALIHANNFDKEKWTMADVTVFFFDKGDNFTKRMDSSSAALMQGYWEIRTPLVNDKEDAEQTGDFHLPTALTERKIEDSFADPDTVSFWNIVEYAKVMEETGFPSTRLLIHYHALLAQPIMFIAVIFLSAAFSLRPQRFGGTGVMIALGVSAGFFIFFLESMLHAFGASQKIAVVLAAWTPSVVTLLLGTAALLHKEDG